MNEDRVCPLNPDLEKRGHHWLIDSPKGETSHGRCKYCHTEKDFNNSCAFLWWDAYHSQDDEGQIFPLGRRAKTNYF